MEQKLYSMLRKKLGRAGSRHNEKCAEFGSVKWNFRGWWEALKMDMALRREIHIREFIKSNFGRALGIEIVS